MQDRRRALIFDALQLIFQPAKAKDAVRGCVLFDELPLRVEFAAASRQQPIHGFKIFVAPGIQKGGQDFFGFRVAGPDGRGGRVRNGGREIFQQNGIAGA